MYVWRGPWGKRHFLVEISEGLLRPGGRLISSGKERAEGPVSGGGSLVFQENRRVRFASLGLERRLLIWEKKGGLARDPLIPQAT